VETVVIRLIAGTIRRIGKNKNIVKIIGWK
jgi:hypothetical protein